MIPRYTRPEMGSIWEEQNRWQKILDVELAVCEAQEELGFIPKGVTGRIRPKAAFDVKRIAEIEAVTHHDVIAFLTNVNENVGEEGRYIHQGLTSSDVLDTGYALQMVQAADMLLAGLEELKQAFRSRALEHKHTPIMGRSHGIHAEPMTFGLKMALHYCETERNITRLKRARECIRVGKISGAIGTFSNLAPDVEQLACEKLDLQAAPVSTQVIQRDRYAEYLCTLAIIGASIEKVAVEIRHLQRSEVREVEEFFSKGQKGSSAMPHKRNPIIAERLSGMARLLRANAHTALENVALWHERDISHSSVERVIVPDSNILLDYMLAKLTSLITTLLVYPEAMMENIEKNRGLVYSQKVLLALTGKGMSREDAYALVQRNAMKVWEQKLDFKTALSSDPELTASLSGPELDKIFHLKSYLRNIDAIFRKAGL
ncbi:adenylosuccinate lyase [Planctomycetota bacterium]